VVVLHDANFTYTEKLIHRGETLLTNRVAMIEGVHDRRSIMFRRFNALASKTPYARLCPHTRLWPQGDIAALARVCDELISCSSRKAYHPSVDTGPLLFRKKGKRGNATVKGRFLFPRQSSHAHQLHDLLDHRDQMILRLWGKTRSFLFAPQNETSCSWLNSRCCAGTAIPSLAVRKQNCSVNFNAAGSVAIL
jgi:hypothetical protein